jgi:hypothetical protein
MLMHTGGTGSTGGFLVVLFLELVIVGAVPSILVAALDVRVRGASR